MFEELAASVGCPKMDCPFYVSKFSPTPIVQRPRLAGFLFVVDVLDVKSVWAHNYIADGTDLEELVRTIPDWPRM